MLLQKSDVVDLRERKRDVGHARIDSILDCGVPRRDGGEVRERDSTTVVYSLEVAGARRRELDNGSVARMVDDNNGDTVCANETCHGGVE